MSVLVVPGDSGGCGGYRMRFPANAVAAAGVDVIVGDPDALEITYAGNMQPDGTFRVISVDTSNLPDVDTIVMQRPLQDVGWQFIRALRAKGFRVVVDVDDDFDRLHPANPAARLCATDPRYSPKNIHRAIFEADACTVSTPALADRYRRNGTEIHILRNMVPAWYLDVERAQQPKTIGWTGSIATHHNDLTELGGTLGVMQRDGWSVKVIGRADRTTLGCSTDPQIVPWMPLDQYPFKVATFQVGIVPLRDTAFNTGKSWLKGLEYAALGVPFAASPTPAYRELHRITGVGVLVEKPNRWRRAILEAFEQPNVRNMVVAAGLTYENRWQDWANVWQ